MKFSKRDVYDLNHKSEKNQRGTFEDSSWIVSTALCWACCH